MNVHEAPGIPPGLRGRTLTAALSARPAGAATPVPEPIEPWEAYRRSAAGLDTLLASLEESDWRRPTVRGLDVQGLVGHLIAVEEHLARALDCDPAVGDADHVASTQDVAAGQTERVPAQTHRDWAAAVARCLDAAPSAELGADTALHGLRMPVGSLLVARAFELWIHAEDICRAIGRPPSPPDASTLTLMTELAVSALPTAVEQAGTVGPVELRLVLTGPGGGTRQLALGTSGPEPLGEPGPDGPAALGIVTSAVDFCRVVGDRLGPDELEQHVTGDQGTALAILNAAATLALD